MSQREGGGLAGGGGMQEGGIELKRDKGGNPGKKGKAETVLRGFARDRCRINGWGFEDFAFADI